MTEFGNLGNKASMIDLDPYMKDSKPWLKGWKAAADLVIDKIDNGYSPNEIRRDLDIILDMQAPKRRGHSRPRRRGLGMD